MSALTGVQRRFHSGFWFVNPWQDIEFAIREALDAPFAIESRAEGGGGCINTAWRIRGKGLSCFVKVNRADKAEMFSAEAAGLEAIARTRTARVPKPVCHGAN